jgi:hypothetical protein
MKDTALDSVGVPAGINVEEGGGGKVATLVSPESSLLAQKILPTPRAIHCLKAEEYERWAFLSALPRTTMLLGCKRCSRSAPPQHSRASVVALHLSRKTEVNSQMKRHASSVRLVTSRQLRVRRTLRFVNCCVTSCQLHRFPN